MKCSVSMSCLATSTSNSTPKVQKTTPDTKKPNRLCNSLSSKKSRKSLDKKRRSWGSTELMSQEEIWKSCLQFSQEAISEFSSGEGEAVREFLEDYSQISEWLNSVQAERSKFADSKILSHLADEMQQKQHMQRDMNERGRILVKTFPRLNEEFQWRIKHMNSQWDSLEKILLCQSSLSAENNRSQSNANSSGDDSKWDIDWVSRWLRQMEDQIHPLAFNVQWTPACIQEELTRHQDLQTEIEGKSSLVHGALRQCRSSCQGQSHHVSKKRVDILESRWIQLRLRIIEWVEHLSRIQAKEAIKELGRGSENTFSFDSEWKEISSDEEASEPLNKYRRLGSLTSLDKDNYKNTNTDDIEVDEGNNVSSWRMGQSHEQHGNIYLSGSPVSNSVIELQFDELSSGNNIGLKRKISSSSSSYSQQLKFTTPMNISTYYFKHSDTEAEGTQSLSSISKDQNGDSYQRVHSVSRKTKKERTPSPVDNSLNRWKCQKTLDFSQEETIHPVEVLFQSPSSELAFELSEELEEMDQETTAAIQNLNEIEELVQKAELLVKGRKGNRQRNSEPWIGDSGFLPLVNDYSASLRRRYTKGYGTLGEEENGNGLCSCKMMNLEEVGAVGGFCDNCDTVNGAANNVSGGGPKKRSRVRQWIRAHNNSALISEQKCTSSCDASGESASESDEFSSSNEEPQHSSDDPTILTASTTFLQQQQQYHLIATSSPKRGSYNSLYSAVPPVVFRSKKNYPKQRPKSFTDNLSYSGAGPNHPSRNSFTFDRLNFDKALSPIHDQSNGVFVSDTALNYFEHGRSNLSSPEDSQLTLDALTLKDRRKGKFKRRLSRQKKRASLDLEDEVDHFASTSTFGGFAEMEHQLEDIELNLPNAPVLKPLFKLDPIETASVNTEELPLTNDQDWDSYQEKYLSEPYSEEPYDQDRTLKLLAFGEDYDQVLDRPDSESSSVLSGFQDSNPSKRRPLTFNNTRGEMAESDSDRDELNHFLVQSVAQHRFVDNIFRKQLNNSSTKIPDSSFEYAEMEATCGENINSLKLVLDNVEKPDGVIFDLDLKSIQDVLDNWELLRNRIVQTGKLQQIQSDLKFLRKNFESIQRDLGLVDPFDSKDIQSLQSKIEKIQSVLNELMDKKGKLQSVNEASVETQIYLKDANKNVKKQLKNLYALYEENFQLGSYLLDKMRFLEDAWSTFEQERDAFEKSLSLKSGGVRVKGKKSLSSGASTDSGHGTDFSHDSSISDSDIDEKRQKLVALRNRAMDLKAFLPPGSPVLDIIDTKINEAQREFEMVEKVGTTPLNLKLIFPKRKSPARKPNFRSSKSPPQRIASLSRPRSASTPPSSLNTRKDSSRHWRTIRFSITFHLALMGLFAVAWFLQPRCCENLNTYSFSLVPHLTHERIPHM